MANLANASFDGPDGHGPGHGSGDDSPVAEARDALSGHGGTGLRGQLALLVELAEADPNELTVGERVDAVRAAVALSGQVDAALCRHAAGFDAHLDYVGDGARSASAWIGARTEMSSTAGWGCPSGRPLTRKRSRTHLNADLYFEQAGQTIEIVMARPRR